MTGGGEGPRWKHEGDPAPGISFGPYQGGPHPSPTSTITSLELSPEACVLVLIHAID